MTLWKEDRARNVEVLLGACLLIRRLALDQVGSLDEDFFMYSEEVDLCYRLRRCGWNLYWVPQAEVIHYGGQSTGQVPSEMFLQLYRSKVLFFRKHHGRLGGRLYKIVLLLAALPRAILPFSPPPALSGHRRYYKPIGGNYRRLIMELPRL